MPRFPDFPTLPARPDLPLLGLTLLALEDSRFASDALRLLSQRSGARLRRAETLEAAWSHLRVYKPDAILVDLGLPDGRGESLIRQVAASGSGRPALIGISGDPDGRALALAAGADGFLEKPVAGLAAFQRALLSALPDRGAPSDAADGAVEADLLALHDDLAQAAEALRVGPGPDLRRYLAGFLAGLARQTRDDELAAASLALVDPEAGLAGLSHILGDRLARTEAFRSGAA